MKRIISGLIILICAVTTAQKNTGHLERYPVFDVCADSGRSEMERCFNRSLQNFISDQLKIPEEVMEDEYTGSVDILFEVTKEGKFEVLFIDSPYESLKTETLRVFENLPVVGPPTYNGKPTYMQFTYSVLIPLRKPGEKNPMPNGAANRIELLTQEYDAIENLPYENEEYHSNINIPLSHHNYSRFDPALNRVGLNSHTAQKPYTYEEVNRYYHFETENTKLLKNKSSWFGRKFWNEHFVTIKGDDYWLTINPGVDLQLGKDLGGGVNTYNNTRIAVAQGGIGSKIGFHGVIYESQGRFADYFNRFAETLAPAGGNPGIIPGQGVAKRHRSDAYDYPVGTGYFSYTPSKTFNIQFGHGKTFIGDGYRSLFTSDAGSSYPFLKLNTTFWKLKYTNTWMSLRDVRKEVAPQGSFKTKYVANHYLSYNVTKRLNLGFFEAVVWESDNGRGFDVNYLNPVIFYRAIEFSTGGRGGNALIGLAGKYKFTDYLNIYGQFIIDEFSSSEVFSGDKHWKNKTGYQIGLKYYDAFGLSGLYLQTEYSRVRPYTYSHNTITLNYGHLNQSLAHPYGANFSEFIVLARYQKGRFFGDAKVVVGKRGFDFNTDEDSMYYGGDIYRSEYEDMPWETGNKVGQGNTTDFFYAELEAGYLINPASNLKVYGQVIFRDFKPAVDTEVNFKNNTTWINFGIRTDLFNWYFDY